MDNQLEQRSEKSKVSVVADKGSALQSPRDQRRFKRGSRLFFKTVQSYEDCFFSSFIHI